MAYNVPFFFLVKFIKLWYYLSGGYMNNLVLAYLGDAVYELYIREYLISKDFCKVNDLQNESLKYVSAKSQSDHLERLIKSNFLTEDELDIVKRGRNMSSHKSKSTDIITYKRSTGLECLIGSLRIEQKNERIKEIMEFIVGD